MFSLDNLLATMDEGAIAKNVGIPHDEARMRYFLSKNTVESFDEFTDVIGDYYNHHISECVVRGGIMSRTEAAGKAKEILMQEYRPQGGNVITAYKDAQEGTNGGVRVVLDRIAESLKTESVERYIRDAFDRYVDPSSWTKKVDIMNQFMVRYGHMLSPTIRVDQPESYAQNYEELIRAYVDALKRTSTVFRRF
jgi:hypothetical protein